MYSRKDKQGSALVMVVGLLAIIAMLGGTALILANLDRETTDSLAKASPATEVAPSILQRLVTELWKDLHLSSTVEGPYADADPDFIRETYDYPYPSDEVDRFLATPTWYDDGGTKRWRHLSKPSCAADLVANVVDVEVKKIADNTDENYVDTDGDGWCDAILFNSGLQDGNGGDIKVAVRVIDLSGLLNVNVANEPQAAAANAPMRTISLALAPFTSSPQTVHEYRTGTSTEDITQWYEGYVRRALSPLPLTGYYVPFGVGDLLATTWLGISPDFSETTRIRKAVGETFPGIRKYLTTWSVSRARIRKPIPGTAPLTVDQKFKADLNKADFDTLFSAFYNALSAGCPLLPDRATAAAQLAVNVLDFRDANSTPRRMPVPDVGTRANPKREFVCGVERQPFIVEAGYKIEPPDTGPTLEYYALEIYNPYATDLVIYESDGSDNNWKVCIKNKAYDLGSASTPTLGAHGRLVIVNDAAVQVASGASKIVRDELDFSHDSEEHVRILRPIGPEMSDGAPTGRYLYAVVDSISPGENFHDSPKGEKPKKGDPPKIECIRRVDARKYALYSLALYRNNIEADITADITGIPGTLLLTDNHLGSRKTEPTPGINSTDPGDLTTPGAKPTPIYVRNDSFISLGELLRVYHVGPGWVVANSGPGGDVTPGEGKAMPTELAPPEDTEAVKRLANGRVGMMADRADTDRPSEYAIPDAGWERGVPFIPLGALLADFLMVDSPMADGVDNDGDGKIDSADDDGGEDRVFGKVNVNTAPKEVLEKLLAMSGIDPVPRELILAEIIAYRDLLNNSVAGQHGTNYTVPGGRKAATDISNLRGDKGFASIGEVAIPIYLMATSTYFRETTGTKNFSLPYNSYLGSNQAPNNYGVDADGNDDGLVTGVNAVLGDLSKYHLYWTWLANQVTVRSDTFLAYIYVKLPTSALPFRYVAVIDRSNCRESGDTPQVLMFAEIR